MDNDTIPLQIPLYPRSSNAGNTLPACALHLLLERKKEVEGYKIIQMRLPGGR